MLEVLAGASLLISLVNALIFTLTFQRAGRWRDLEDAKALIQRMSLAEGEITGLKARMENVATKADVARLTAEVSGLEMLIKNTEAGVVRIEQLLMRANP